MRTDSKPSVSAAAIPWLLLALAAGAAWTWISLCRFPNSPWNDLRLAPVFMAATGEPVYTLPGQGVLTTWMYGPVPLWVWWPATLASNAIAAVMAAGILNLALGVAAIGATCRWWPNADAGPQERLLVFATCLALWPDHVFLFLQADNVAVALGLASNLLLSTGRSNTRSWLAALATAAALGCKQTTLGLLLAQLAWLWTDRGRGEAARHLGRTIAAGIALLAIAVLQFGASELRFGLVTVPGALPPVEDIGGRLAALAPVIALQVGGPIALLLIFGRRVFAPGSFLNLPALAFLGSLPLGLAGMLSTGGSINSFQGLQYILPALLLFAITGRPSVRSIPPVIIATGVALVVTLRIVLADFTPIRPALGLLRQAADIQRARPGEVWLPWNPLVTYFDEGRFDHAEDGIYVRFITGNPVSLAHAQAGIPPRMRAIAFPSPEMQWGVAAKLAPPTALSHREGNWLVIDWPDPPTGR